MDAWIQKLRITRWQERFLAVFSLGMSCRVRTAKLLDRSSERRSTDSSNNIPALVGLFLSGVSAQVSADWDAGTGKCFASFQTAMEGACALNNPDSTTAPGYVYYRDRCIITSIPNFFVYAHVVTPAGRSLPFTYTRSLPQCDFTISLSGDTEVEPSTDSAVNTLPFIAIVKNRSTGQPVTDPVEVHISLKVDPTSGGHDHADSTRPRGGIAELKSCPTDDECWTHATDNGAVVFNFNPTDASGTHTITATCNGCTNNPQTAEVKVKVDGLEIIPDSSFYTFIGGGVDKPHHDNHYLTPEAATVLRNVAISYRIEDKFWQLKQARRGKKGQYAYTAPSVLYVNDASLKWGGKFDIYGKWKGDHQGHKRGIVVDIRANQININNGAIPLQSFTNFQKLAKSYNAIAQVHCSDDGQDRQPPACIGSDGSQDDLRHFHVILIGGVDK